MAEATVVMPATYSEALNVVYRQDGPPLTARGLGRSYGDSALGPAISCMTRMSMLQHFDPKTGVLSCAAGVSLADMLDIFVERGWFLPVTPGTKFVTVGGAIASDVHGKNHHRDGCFSEFVDSITLMLGDGSLVTCSRQENADLFRATCGGMGLTGLIVSASLRLRSIQGPMIEQTTFKARHLEELLSLFAEQQDAYYSVAWIDCLATGSKLGRGLLMTGKHIPGLPEQAVYKNSSLSVPFDMPSCILNRVTMKGFNALYYGRIRQKHLMQQMHYEPFFYPLDSVRNWNRFYGVKGFVQYQFVLPKTVGPQGLAAVLTRIAQSERGSFLAVLKVLGRANDNHLSFPVEGYTLALDFKMGPGVLEMLNAFDAVVLDYGGRLYLAKDARMSTTTFRRSYPQWETFQNIRARYKAIGKFASHQSKRLGME